MTDGGTPVVSRDRRIGAMLASLSAPGAGLFVLGRWGRGAAWAVASLGGLLVGFVGFRIHPPLLFLGLLVGPVVWVACLVDTWRAHAGRTLPPVAIAVVAWLALGIADRVPAVLYRAYVVEAFKISSGSMQPTLKIGDHVFVEKAAYASKAPERGDVVVYEMPGDRSKKFAKRIAGVSGDTLEIREGALVVNGEEQPRSSKGKVEAYGIGCESVSVERFEETLGGTTHSLLQSRTPGWSGGPWTVPSGELFVLGDDRDNSHDSSRGGYTVPLDHVTGRVSFVWFSWDPCKGHVRTKRLGDLIH